MFHPVAYARGIFKEELDGPKGPVGCAVYSHEFYETDTRRGFPRGVQLQVSRENPPLVQALRLDPAWGREAQRLLQEEFLHCVPVVVMVEDLPEAHNRVTLTDRIETDGLPGVKLEYTLSAESRRALDFGLDRAEEMLRAAGAYRVARTPLAPLTGWHLLGTARMGSAPARSVTDGRGRCHAAPNLIVADGSLWPTVGAVNPGSTIGALALKLADDLAMELA
jgi:choline dehydrogenase-like flavoprotein